MIKYLQDLIKSSDVLGVSVNNQFHNRGILAIDEIGIVIDNPTGPLVFPWHTVSQLTVCKNG